MACVVIPFFSWFAFYDTIASPNRSIEPILGFFVDPRKGDAMAFSPLTVIVLLSVLCIAGWVIYRMLENIQDNLNGLTLEGSLAKRDGMGAPSRRREVRDAGAVWMGDSMEMISRSSGQGVARASGVRRAGDYENARRDPIGMAGGANRFDPAAHAFHYPKVVYQCPYMIGRGGNPHAALLRDRHIEKAG